MFSVTSKVRIEEEVAGIPVAAWMQKTVQRISQDPIRKPRIVDATTKGGVRTLQIVDDSKLIFKKEKTFYRLKREVREFHGKYASDKGQINQ